MLFPRLPELLAQGVAKPVCYAVDPAAFLAATGPMLAAMTGDPEAAAYLLADWQLRLEHRSSYQPTNALARLLGRQPVSVREWIAAHRAALV